MSKLYCGYLWCLLSSGFPKVLQIIERIEEYFFLSKSKQVVQLVIISRENENQMHPFPYAVGY